MTHSPGTGWRRALAALRSRARRTGPVCVELLVTARSAPGWRRIDAADADGDAPELTLDELEVVASNLAELGVSTVELGGHEPFVREDLPEIVAAFTRAGIAARLRTAGSASRHALAACADAGARDIQVSLDTLDPALQDRLDGVAGAWDAILGVIAAVNETFPTGGVRGFDVALMPATLEHVIPVASLAAHIGWSISVVPVHTTDVTRPRAHRAFDRHGTFSFAAESAARVCAVLDQLARLGREHPGLIAHPDLLAEAQRFIAGQPVAWRRFHGDVCDAPSLYFAIDPAGRVAPCRDHRLTEAFAVHDERFPLWFRDGVVHRACRQQVAACEGCMHGPYAAISLAARSLRAPMAGVPRAARRPPTPGFRNVEEIRRIAMEIRASLAAPAHDEGAAR